MQPSRMPNLVLYPASLLSCYYYCKMYSKLLIFSALLFIATFTILHIFFSLIGMDTTTCLLYSKI